MWVHIRLLTQSRTGPLANEMSRTMTLCKPKRGIGLATKTVPRASPFPTSSIQGSRTNKRQEIVNAQSFGFVSRELLSYRAATQNRGVSHFAAIGSLTTLRLQVIDRSAVYHASCSPASAHPKRGSELHALKRSDPFSEVGDGSLITLRIVPAAAPLRLLVVGIRATIAIDTGMQ